MKGRQGIPVWYPLPWEKRRTDSEISPMNLFQCGFERQPVNIGNVPLIRNHLLIFYVVKGQGTYFQGNKAIKIVPGQVFILLPDLVTDYIYDDDNPWEYYFLTFLANNADFYANLSALGIDNNNCVLTLNSPISVISEWLSHVVESFMEPDENKFRSLGYMYLFLAEIAEASPLKKNRETGEQYIDKIIRYVLKNFARNLTVDSLAKQFNLSRSHLCRLFKAYTGLSPQRYLINTRVEAAKSFLASSRYSMKEIAQNCGFRDSMHLSIIFKSYTSLSPTEYRKSMQK